jgi:hypothetical protein
MVECRISTCGLFMVGRGVGHFLRLALTFVEFSCKAMACVLHVQVSESLFFRGSGFHKAFIYRYA